jgi:hypothetical protein
MSKRLKAEIREINAIVRDLERTMRRTKDTSLTYNITHWKAYKQGLKDAHRFD